MSAALDFLFPTPSAPASTIAPRHWPGVSPQSTDALLKVLKDNHVKWHTFTNEKHFHNHAPHRSLALWSMGAPGEVIETAYNRDCNHEKPIIPPPRKITVENFNNHLGDEDYYRAYLEFFVQYIKDHGVDATLEDHLFSAKANLGDKHDPPEKRPRMLARLLSGVVHPLIHTGNGVEFGLPGMIAEGLAQAAVHAAAASPLVPPSLFEDSRFSKPAGMAESAGRAIQGAFGATMENIDTALDTALQKTLRIGDAPRRPAPAAPSKDMSLQPEDRRPVRDVHALDILGWVSQDLRFAPAPNPDQKNSFDGTIGKHAHSLLKFANIWTLDVEKLGHDQRYLQGKIEELAFLVTVMYGIGGWTGRGKDENGQENLFNADFFLMHLVTSSVFIPSICAHISAPSRARFLHTYLAVCLAMYVFRGCPPLDIIAFAQRKPLQPFGPQPHPSKDTLPSPDDPQAVNADPWLSIIQNAIVHPDEHLTKSQRSLSHWGSLFGTRRFTSSSLSKLGGSSADPSHGEYAAGLGMGWGGDTQQSRVGERSQGRGGAEGRPIELELDGAEYLDGNVFVRTAELTAERMGRVREGEPTRDFWDFKGFYASDTNPVKERKAHL